MKLIGISGKAGTGKSTLTEHLLAMLGDGWKRVGFADVLKTEVALTFGFPVEWCYTGKDRKVKGQFPGIEGTIELTVRHILQWWGTDVCRAKDENHWVGKMRDQLEIFRQQGVAGCVIDDIRFPNEANLVREQNGLLARIMPFPGYAPPAGQEGVHVSETAMDTYADYDVLLAPDYGKLEAAAKTVKQCLEEAQ